MSFKKGFSIILSIALVLSVFLPMNTGAVASNDVVISEVAWMGTTYSYNDEWLELYNDTSSSINLTGWTLNSTDGSPSITLSGSIPANGHFLLERTDDTSVVGVTADMTYSGSLGNTGETLELRDETGALIDTVNAWYGGDNSSKATMERIDSNGLGTSSSSWATATATYDGGYGTPTSSASGSTGGGSTGGGSGSTGSGTWTEGNLEIHHINIGQGNATLVIGPTGKTLLIDAGESYWNTSEDAETMGPYIESITGSKHLDYVLISHFHLDHIGYVGYGGLWHLVEQQGFTVGQMIHRDFNTYLGDTSGTFNNWVTYLEGPGKAKLNPVVAVEGTSQIDLGTGVTVDIVATDGNGALLAGDFSLDTAPPSENDYSIAVKISYGLFDEFIGGDMDGEYTTSSYGYSYHDIELTTALDVGDVDVLLANHHGSDHSNNATFIGQLDPEVSIISVGDDNPYGHPRQTVVDRLLATSDVYMTEKGEPTVNTGNAVVGGHIVIKTSDGINYTVDGNSYVATNPTRIDSDGDGYFIEVDPDDGNRKTTPQPNGGYNTLYQP